MSTEKQYLRLAAIVPEGTEIVGGEVSDSIEGALDTLAADLSAANLALAAENELRAELTTKVGLLQGKIDGMIEAHNTELTELNEKLNGVEAKRTELQLFFDNQKASMNGKGATDAGNDGGKKTVVEAAESTKEELKEKFPSLTAKL